MSQLAELTPRWQQRLDQLVDELDVPGAAVGISHRGERVVITAGIENLRSGHPVVRGTAFQIGSISKVYTATLLAAVAELDDQLLGTSVASLIPEAQWMDARITVRHLLTHTSGLAGDYFADTGRGDDALAKYVAQLQPLANDFPGPPGERYSYCNSGFAVLGRLIELLTGKTYESALQQHLLRPLGTQATTSLPEEALLWPHAMGHNRFEHSPLHADNVWRFARAATAIGGICAPADELLAFGEMHLANGVARDGTRVISEAAAVNLRERHFETPRFGRPSARGLGWGIYDTDQGQIVGHDGETLGQIAKLRIVPEHGLALTVLTNAIPDGNQIAREFEAEILNYVGITISPLKVVTPDHFDANPYLGRYRNLEGMVEVEASERGLRLRNAQLAEGLWGEVETSELIPIGHAAFVDAADARPLSAQRFGDLDEDRRCRSYFNGRVFWRTEDA